MHGNNKNNSSPNPENNPYLNDKLYPATIMMSSSIMDVYLSQVFTPYNGYFEQEQDPSIQECYDSITKELYELVATFKPLIDALNGNHLDGMKQVYSMFCSMFDNDTPKLKTESIISSSMTDADIKMSSSLKKSLEDLETARKYQRKQMFIESIHEYFITPIKKKIDDYNKYNSDSFLLVDSAEVVAISKKRGVITKKTTKLTPQEIEMIRYHSTSIFNAMSKVLNMDIDTIFVDFIVLMTGFKHRPFGVLFTDKRPGALFRGYDFYNSMEIRNLIDQGLIDDYFDTLHMSNEEVTEYNANHYGISDTNINRTDSNNLSDDDFLDDLFDDLDDDDDDEEEDDGEEDDE